MHRETKQRGRNRDEDEDREYDERRQATLRVP